MAIFRQVLQVLVLFATESGLSFWSTPFAHCLLSMQEWRQWVWLTVRLCPHLHPWSPFSACVLAFMISMCYYNVRQCCFDEKVQAINKVCPAKIELRHCVCMYVLLAVLLHSASIYEGRLPFITTNLTGLLFIARTASQSAYHAASTLDEAAWNGCCWWCTMQHALFAHASLTDAATSLTVYRVCLCSIQQSVNKETDNDDELF